MAASLGVKGAKGGDGAPAIRQIAGVLMFERNRGGTEIERRAREYRCIVAPKAGAVPVENGGNVHEVVVEKPWCPCCKAHY